MTLSQGVILTGARGFLGRQVLRRLLDENFAVLAIERRGASRRAVIDTAPHVVRHYGDEELPDEFLQKYCMAAIIHAATSYGRDGLGLAGILETNLHLPLRLIEQLNRRRIACDFINCGTSIPAFTNPYALSKAQFAQWLQLLARDIKNWRAINLVFHYIYGSDEVGPKFSASLIAACRNGDAEFQMTAGTQARDFIHVADAADAVLAAVSQRTKIPFGYTAMDVGTGKATALRDFAELAVRISRAPTRIKCGRIPPRADEPAVLVANTSPLAGLGWRAQLDVASGLNLIFSEPRA